MPMDSLLVLIAVGFVFLLFAVVVAWADHSTTKWLQAKAEKRAVAEPESHHKRAA